ncbi:tetratricopeptide repeat protein [Leucobacter salsicius]|uniref:tetratricopeptide repeat protein n=1 Tax=Leucobacter salsicius TaxID=664638 RepID=UPI0003476686|nr:tetratricopeptide repeat protein [Leucobacter salsicius]
MADILLGGHRRIVEELASRLRALQRGDLAASRVVLLNAAAGEGKTRIIRELFARLRAQHDELQNGAPQYWPERAGDARSGAASPILAREEIAPPGRGFVGPTDAQPGFGWWAFDGQRLNAGVAHSLAAEVRSQWQAHAEALARARNEAAGGAVRNLPGEVPSEGIALGRALRSLSHPRLPGVIVIEDAHLMGAELAALVEEASMPDPDRPLLIIGTVEAGAPQHPEFVRWMARLRDLVECIDVVQLPAADLISMLREAAPRTDDATAMRTVARLGGPLSLKLWLTSDAVHRHIQLHGGALELRELSLPADAAQVLAAQWDGLPEVVRAVLSCAVVANPLAARSHAASRRSAAPVAVDGLAADGLVHVVPEVMAAAFAEFLGVAATPERLQEAFAAAVEPAGWCREDGGVLYFREGLLADVARAAVRAPEGQTALRAIVRRHIERWIDATHDEYTLPATETASILARWYIALSRAPAPVPGPHMAATAAPPPTEALAAAHWRMACDAAARNDYTEAISHGRRARALLRQVLGENYPAEYLRDHRLPGKAASQHQVAPVGAMQLVIAEWMGESGRAGDAIEELRTLLADMERLAGTHHIATLSVRRDLARQLSEVGIAEEAIGQFQTVIADLSAMVGPLSPETLEARGGLAEALGVSGQYDQAVAELRALIPLYLEVYGESHPGTFLVRGALAAFLSQSGQPFAAVEQARMLLEDQDKVLGAADPQVLTTRSNLAVMLLDSGDPDAAVEQFAQLAAERAELLGVTDPDTLDTRMNLALALLEAGRAQAAVHEFRAVLEVMRRTLAEDHPDLLRGRGQLAEALGRAGNPRAAVLELHALKRDVARSLGPRAGEIASIAAAARFWERGLAEPPPA